MLQSNLFLCCFQMSHVQRYFVLFPFGKRILNALSWVRAFLLKKVCKFPWTDSSSMEGEYWIILNHVSFYVSFFMCLFRVQYGNNFMFRNIVCLFWFQYHKITEIVAFSVCFSLNGPCVVQQTWKIQALPTADTVWDFSEAQQPRY